MTDAKKGLWLGAILTPVAVVSAIVSGGAGHGDYVAAKVLYPYSMLLTLSTEGTIAAPSLILALIQFPLYGAAIGHAKNPERQAVFFVFLVLLLALHVGATVLCFSGAIPNF